jgi:hypothetical protein
MPEQTICPVVGQAQTPLLQLCEDGQMLSHLPQLLLSVSRFLHVPLQLVSPGLQISAQFPAWQI